MIAVISFAAAVILTAVVFAGFIHKEKHARQTYEEMQQQNSREKRQTDTAGVRGNNPRQRIKKEEAGHSGGF